MGVYAARLAIFFSVSLVLYMYMDVTVVSNMNSVKTMKHLRERHTRVR